MPKKKMRSLVIWLLYLGLHWFDSFPGLEAATGKLASIPGLYVFGDSLVDAGNNNYLPISIAKANYPRNGVDFPKRKATGRFSNGKNAADFIAEKFGLPLPPPYRSLKGALKVKKRESAALTGLNFASGGAGIFNSSDKKLGQSIPLSHQVNDWLSIHNEVTGKLRPAEAQVHLSKSLFIVVIGSNDLFDYYGSFKTREQNNPQQYTQSMADKLKEQLKRIHETGARRFLVVGVAQIGCIPGNRDTDSDLHECDEEANRSCSLYNEALVKMLQQLKQELQNSMRYSYFDNFKSLQDINSNPIRFGFTEVTSACCGSGKLNAGTALLPNIEKTLISMDLDASGASGHQRFLLPGSFCCRFTLFSCLRHRHRHPPLHYGLSIRLHSNNRALQDKAASPPPSSINNNADEQTTLLPPMTRRNDTTEGRKRRPLRKRAPGTILIVSEPHKSHRLRETTNQSMQHMRSKDQEEQPSTRNENDSKEENEVKPQGWRTAHIRKKQEWQNKLKNLRIGRKEVVEDKDKAEDSTMLAPFYDQNSLILKAQEQEAKASDVGNLVQVLNAVDVNSIPRGSIVKQLAVAIEAGKMAKTMKEFAASSGSSSPGRDRGGLSLSAVKSMVLGEKEDKFGFDSRDEEKLVSLINAMFNVDGNFLVRMIVSDLESPTNRASFAKDLHVAPPSSFVVKLAEVIGSFTTPSRMALFWCRVVDELRRFWNEKKHIPWIPLDENPDLKSCLLHQWLQVINCCLGRKARCIAASEALDAVMRQASPANEKSDISEAMGSPVSLLYAKSNTGELILRLGIHHQVENLTMLETGEPVFAPITQEGPLLTEDLIKETEELVLRTGSMGAGCSQLLSDMQAFKAANPGCILEDFVRWHSPPDWTGNDTSSGDDSSPLRGQLSIRMQKEGNLWRELWETAKPLPAVKQTPLYDEDFAVEGILNSLEDITPVDFFGQLFVSLVALGFVMAEPVVATNDDLSKLFFECKDYVVATCQGDAWTDKLDDLCQVYETVETMLVRPEKVLRSMKQTEESPSGGNETKRRFRRLNFIFRGKEGNKNRVPSETEQKSTEPSPRQSFSSLFDGKSSLDSVRGMMLRAVIRRASTRGGSSASSGLGKSLQSSRVAASSQSFHSLSATQTLVPRGSHARSCFHHRSCPGCSECSRTLLTSFQGTTLQRWVRPFSSDSGDVVEAVVPHMGESITDGTLANFLKKPGDRVEADEAIAQIETDKVTIDIASPASGVIQEFLVKEGDTVEPGNKVAIISKSADAVSHVAPSEKIPEKATPKPSPPAEEPKVESTKAAEKPKASPPPSKQSAKEPQLPPKDRERRVPMTRLRKRVATRLKDSQNTFALLTTFNEVDMTNLMKLRSQYKDAFFEKHGVKLGLMSGFIKAAVSALQAQPVVNAVIDGDDIIYRDYVDISIAVGTSKGLVVPVIRGADQMNFADIEKTINSLAKKANEGTISIDEMAGGSFTVSNGGVYGSLISTPIINPPQSAILGMHSIVQRPMVVGGSVVPRPMMYVALTYDHRLIDGREAVYFLRRIKDVVEDPQRLLLDI
ncbi:unnamed protein product [Brassica rapa subsp. trilocularis]